MKPRLSQGLPIDIQILKMFPPKLNMKNSNRVQKMFFQNSTKDRITHFNISVIVKSRGDNI